MSTVYGWKSTKNFDRVVNTKIIPGISEAYGELILGMEELPGDDKNKLLVKVTEHLIALLGSECMYNALKKLSCKELTERLTSFSEDEYNKQKQETLQRQ